MGIILSIPFILYKRNNPRSCIRYFIIQSLASLFVLISFKINEFFDTLILIEITLSLKLGLFPFRFWVEYILTKIEVFRLIPLIMINKIPRYILLYTIKPTEFWLFVCIISIVYGRIIRVNDNRLINVLVKRSISHSGVLGLFSRFNIKLFFVYYFFYLIRFSFALWLKYKKMLNGGSSFALNRIVGIPIFLGFLPKFLVIYFFLTNNFIFLFVIISLTSIITTYFFLRLYTISLDNWKFNFTIYRTLGVIRFLIINFL